MSNKVLLTGAGFSANFGAPLALEIATLIFNEPIIQQNDNLRNRLQNNFDYESVYNEVISGDSDDEKSILTEAIKRSYRQLDEQIVRYPTGQTYFNLFRDFIYKFSKKHEGSGYFFTLNQDLLIERQIERDPAGCTIFELPIMGSSIHSGDMNRPQDGISERFFPADFNESKNNYNPDKFDLKYIKLHGSQGWYADKNRNIMILGRDKVRQIERNQLLNWYFEIFKNKIKEPETKLMIIGYGFKDAHINEALENAAINLKIYIINTESRKEFMEGLRDKPSGPRICDLICGYYQRRLTELFPRNPMENLHPDWQMIQTQFFDEPEVGK